MLKSLIGFITTMPLLKNFNGDNAATLSMRWARPIFFILMTTMFVIGWYYPTHIDVFFVAMTKAPEWLTNIFTILILGLTVEKGISRPLHNAYVATRTKPSEAEEDLTT